MFYAILKAIHLLSLVVWMGGMFFALACLRPALATLDAPARLPLMREVLRRFFDAVGIAILLMLVTGGWMLGSRCGPRLRAASALPCRSIGTR